MLKNKKIIIEKWPDNIKTKKELLLLLKESKKNTLKRKTKILVIPPILFLDFLNSTYTGNNLFFVLSNTNFIKSPEVIKNLKINYSCIKNNFNQKNIFLKNNINLLFEIKSKEMDTKGGYLKDLEQQIKNIFDLGDKENLANIFLVYKTETMDLKNIKNNFQNLERTIMFLRKQIYDIFSDESKKVKIFYSIAEDYIDKYSELPFLDGVYVNK